MNWSQPMSNNNRTHRGRNEGSFVKLPNGCWRVWVSLPYGQRVSKTLKSKSEAIQWSRMRTSEHNFYGKNSSLTIEEYLLEWLKKWRIKKALHDSTFIDYQRIINTYILPSLGKIQINKLNGRAINSFYESLVCRGVRPPTVSYVHRVFRAALADAARNEIIDSSLLAKIQAPKKPSPSIDKTLMPLSQEDIFHLLNHALKSRIGPLVFIAITTGFRAGELIGLQWDDVDLLKQTICVKRTYSRALIDGRITHKFGPPKTRSGYRVNFLDEASIIILRYQLNAVRMMKLVAGPRWIENNLIFPTSIGTPFNPSNLRKYYHGLLRDLNIKKIRLHDLRHIFASVMTEKGISLPGLSGLLGHADYRSTLGYLHGSPEMKRMAARAMGDYLSDVQLPDING